MTVSDAVLSVRLRPGQRYRVVVGVVIAVAACRTPGTPKIDGVAGAPPNRATPWTVPAPARTPPPPAARPDAGNVTDAIRADSATLGSARHLSLADVVDLALHHNPATRESWANALAAVNAYGSSKGARYPSVNANVNLISTFGNGGFGANGFGGFDGGNNPGNDSTNGGFGGAGGGNRTTLRPSFSLSYLLFDGGARAGSIEAAKQTAIATNLAHNVTVQNVVLQAESSLFSFLATRALRDAQRTAVAEARSDTAAAEARLRVGLGTLEDVYQTRTALAQALFQLATYQGNLLAARATLAGALGVPANADFDIPNVLPSDSVASISASIDTLINRAIVKRPDLAQVRAQAEALAAQIRVARSAGYPSLTLNWNGGTQSNISGFQSFGGVGSNRFSALELGLQIPIFNGFSRQYDVRAARANYEAGLARVQTMREQITVQVFTSYVALRTARERVVAATELLASAQLSAGGAAGRYREGVGLVTDVILTRSSLVNARAEFIQARWEWQTALAQLAHDVGSLDISGRPHLPLGPP